MFCEVCNAEMPDDHTHEDMAAEESTETTMEDTESVSDDTEEVAEDAENVAEDMAE